MAGERVAEDPYEIQRYLIDRVRHSFSEDQKAPGARGYSEKFWPALIGGLTGRMYRFTDGTELRGTEAGLKILEGLRSNLEPFVDQEGRIGFSNPLEEGRSS